MALSLAEGETKDTIRSGSVLLAGTYAWAATVLEPVARRGASLPARVAAGTALLALVSGCLWGRSRVLVGRGLSLHAFVAASVVVWILSAPSISAERLDPVRGALGSLAWLVFALSWGVARKPSRVPEDDPGVLPGEPFAPQEAHGSRLPIAMGAGIAGAAIPLALAFTVTRKEHALFAHAAAVGLAIAVLTEAARIATAPRAAPLRGAGKARWSSAAVPLLLVLSLVVAGLVAGVKF